ncbi:MAG: NAD(P)-dependent oxidoreductase [Caldilineaceae bacterium]
MSVPKKVLVTGATGHVGSSTYLVLAAQPEKYDVYALDRQREFSGRVPVRNQDLKISDEKFHLCNLADAGAVRQAVEGMDVVVHLGADPGDDGSWESLLNNNIVGTYNVFEACRDAGVPRVIAASSIMVSQGQREQEPYKSIVDKRFDDVPENYPMLTPATPAEPRGIYGATKVWSESLARVYAHTHGMSCICIRIGQVERDRPRPPHGHDFFVSQRDIAQIMECAVNADEKLRFGIFYGISNNDWRWMDIEHAREKLGYVPLDRAEDNFVY